MPSSVSGAEVEMRIDKNFGCRGRVKWCGRGHKFPGEEVDDLAAVEVSNAEFLVLVDGERVAVTGLYGYSCWILG